METQIGSGKIPPASLLEIKKYFPMAEDVLFVCAFGIFGSKKLVAVSENLIKVFKFKKLLAPPIQELKKSDLEFAFFSQSGENNSGSLILRMREGNRLAYDNFIETDAIRVLKVIDIKSAEEITAKKEKRGALLAEVTGFGLGQSGVKVYEGEIHVNGSIRQIDTSTFAEVVSNGQVLMTTRPTLTRMALLAPIPGSALLPGLALAKKQTHDTRSTEIVVAGLNWQATARVNPNDVGRATAVANRINAIANSLMSTQVPLTHSQNQLQPNSSSGGDLDLASQLSSLNELFKSGALSEEEFNKAKSRILET